VLTERVDIAFAVGTAPVLHRFQMVSYFGLVIGGDIPPRVGAVVIAT